jgi:hypothetical protein
VGYSQYPQNRYVSGTYKRVDDISGFDYLRSELVTNYKGGLVHPNNLDEKPRNEKPRRRIRERTLRFE